jgi:hypothetical protein
MKLCCVNCFQTRLIIDEYCISVLFLSRPAVDRFKKPYLHNIITAGGNPRTLVIHQAPFSTAGFASTGRWLSNKLFPIHTQFQTVCLQSNRMCFLCKPFCWPTHVAFWVRLVGCYSMGQCHSVGQVYGALARKGGGEEVHWARIRLWSGRWAVTISPIPVNRHISQAKKMGFLIFLSVPISSQNELWTLTTKNRSPYRSWRSWPEFFKG